ncbi:MAG: hypothetical protein ABR923_07775 [Terracidiphilus sp.]
MKFLRGDGLQDCSSDVLTSHSVGATTMNRAEQSDLVPAKIQVRILLVDVAQTLEDSHLLLLRSIPAMVERLACCADMYVHKGCGYALVILALHPGSRETSDVANYVRHRWRSARILLLQGESTTIDDWLYDERIDPQLHPAIVCETAIRLITEERFSASA